MGTIRNIKRVIINCKGSFWSIEELMKEMGGRSHVQNEALCRFVFPDRPGALMKFLDAFILFLVFLSGDTGANVLVGFQVASTDMDEFQGRAISLGYDYAVESTNEAFQLLMR
ncbi:unnamed protein product [Ilex paraguariensis]|uniref:ACT-like domain-containing protein n=1 Tax=Ilex paraguariensis TaxID=185542 RepID=A0ABC8RDG4_9AQUA